MEEYKIETRKMQAGDAVGLKKNIFTQMPQEMIETNVKGNVEAMAANSNWVYLVATIDGDVVGTTYVEYKERHFEKHIVELYAVVTGELYRGQGICRALFEEVVRTGKENNVKKVILTVRTGTPAETVYQRLGFTKYGELPDAFYENGEYLNKSLYYYDIK